MNPKSQRVNGSSVFHGAGRLEEGGGVRWSEAPGAQQDDPGCLGLLLLGEVKEHAWNGDELGFLNAFPQTPFLSGQHSTTFLSPSPASDWKILNASWVFFLLT